MPESDELLDIVDENNNTLAQDSRQNTYDKGLLHRAVHIIVLDSRKRILLQQRSSSSNVYPLAWDLSCSEHLRVGETFEDAAKRGLDEELGIKSSIIRIRPLHRQTTKYLVNKHQVIEDELVEVYLTVYAGKVKINKLEVNAVSYLSLKAINRMITQGKTLFTPWFLDEWSYLKNTSFQVID